MYSVDQLVCDQAWQRVDIDDIRRAYAFGGAHGEHDFLQCSSIGFKYFARERRRNSRLHAPRVGGRVFDVPPAVTSHVRVRAGP